MHGLVAVDLASSVIVRVTYFYRSCCRLSLQPPIGSRLERRSTGPCLTLLISKTLIHLKKKASSKKSLMEIEGPLGSQTGDQENASLLAVFSQAVSDWDEQEERN